MSYGAGTYTEFANRLNDWLIASSTGANVTNYALDLANRAQNWLTMHRLWDDQLKTQSLTLVSNAASMPADYAALEGIYYDSDSDNKPDGYFYRNGRVNSGYKITDVFTKAGHARTITFNGTVSETPILQYQYFLDDFIGTGTEYSFFPGELLFRTAQMLQIISTGLVNREQQQVLTFQKDVLKEYEAHHLWVNSAMRVDLLDNQGKNINTNDYNLSGGGDTSQPYNDGLKRSTDRG